MRRFLVLLVSAVVLCAIPTGAALAEECMECHGDRGSLEPVSPDVKVEQLLVPVDALKRSVHTDLDCSDCHVLSDSEEDSPHYEQGGGKPVVNCGQCHEKALKEYTETDIHGRSKAAGHPLAPGCAECHGTHDIRPGTDPESMVSHIRQPDMCGRCHGGEELNADGDGGIAKRKLVERYKQSIHWSGVQEGKVAATCADCHGHHSVLPSVDNGSRVTRVNLLTTCAKCHAGMVSEYSKGSHGRTLLHGNLDVPTCTTCHGDHDIISLRMQPGGKRDFAATQVCIWCHGNERMMGRYALDTSPVDSYMKDFHGLAQRGSAGTAATCADCHDAHRSLPHSHPESRMHLSNRGSTCKKCHGDKSSDSFVLSFSHKRAAEEPGSDISYWVALIYIVVILLTLGGMFMHNFVIWLSFARRKLNYQKKHGTVRRLTTLERIWHWAMLVSFIMLALTGFALSYSESFLFRWVYDLGFKEGTRSWSHRMFAMIMVLDTIIFLVYSIVTSRGRRRWWRDMFPRWRDVKDFFATMFFYLGKRRQKPLYPVFNYAEKAEYWALLWGTVVMALTGLVLWFSEALPHAWPPWVFSVARTVHFYEAVLACGAIVIWHFFHVIFHPEEYPLNTSFLTGRLTTHEAQERFDADAVAEQTPRDEEPEPLPDRPWMHGEEG